MSLPPYYQSIRDFERHFQVVLPDSVGQATVGFRDGIWYRLNSGSPHPVPIRSAVILCPHAAGSIVQIACWWMRENARAPRALDLATELALTVGELARKAIEDDPLGMSITTLPPGPQVSSSHGSPALGSGLGSSPLDANPYDSGSYGTNPYATAPTPAPAPYEPAYAAATTLIPQVTADGPYPLGNMQRPAGPTPGLPALPPPSPGRPGPVAPGFGAPRGQGAPGGRPPMGQQAPPGPSGSGNWDRPNGFDPRAVRPTGQPPRQAPGYDTDPRDEYFRNNGPQPQPPRRPERDEYPGGGRPPISRPANGRPEPGRSW
jgi:hypothetical protein